MKPAYNNITTNTAPSRYVHDLRWYFVNIRATRVPIDAGPASTSVENPSSVNMTGMVERANCLGMGNVTFMWLPDIWIIPSESLCCLSYYMENNNKINGGLCGNMKDVREVFDESLKSIAEMLGSNNLKGCYFLSSTLTIFAHISDYRDAVLISEVLESVFSQVGPLLENEQVTTDARVQAAKLLKKPLQEIIDNYKSGDKNKLYTALKDIRFQATGIQLMCWKETINTAICKE